MTIYRNVQFYDRGELVDIPTTPHDGQCTCDSRAPVMDAREEYIRRSENAWKGTEASNAASPPEARRMVDTRVTDGVRQVVKAMESGSDPAREAYIQRYSNAWKGDHQ